MSANLREVADRKDNGQDQLNGARAHSDSVGPRVRLSETIVAGVTLLLDGIAIASGGLLIFNFYVLPGEETRTSAYLIATVVITLASLQGLYALGTYRFTSILHPASQLRRLVGVVISAFFFALALAFALKTADSFSRVWSFSWMLSATTLVVINRFAVANGVRRLAKRGLLGRNIVVYGAGAHGAELISHIEALNEPWLRVVGVFDDRQTRGQTQMLGHPVTGNLQDLLEWSRINQADEILIALPWSAGERLKVITHLLSVLPTDVRLSPEFVDSNLRHQQISHHYGVPMLSVLSKPVSGRQAIIKRVMDIALASVALLIGLPLFALIAVLIKLDSPGPVLFRQNRYGFNNRLFPMYKFRTMYQDQCDQDAARLTTQDDPRVTRVGRVLRRFSLDELPQIFNVLLGSMSIVGPRPHARKAKAGDRLYEEVVERYAARHRVKPGITGWAQVNGWRGNTETEADIIGRVEHDIYYIENWSILLDLWITMRTVSAVLKGENSY